MYKNRLTVLIAAALLIATTATPILAADFSSSSPTSALERVISFFDGMWLQVQKNVCLVGCDRESTEARAKVEGESDEVIEVPPNDGPPSGVVAGLDIFG